MMRPHATRLRALLCFALLTLAPLVLDAQTSVETRLRQHADSLARIRAERDRLQAQLRQMQGQARDLNDEVKNIADQSVATARVVRALDTQLEAINAEVVASTSSLVRAQDELLIKEADLRRRLSEIYRRGPLNTLEVLFSARSFSDLIARYKYLHLQTVRDRAMVKRVADLKSGIEDTRAMRVRLQQSVSTNLEEKASEERRIKALEAQRRQALARVQQSTAQTQRRLTQIAEDERRLNSLISALDRELRSAAGGGVPAGASVFRAGAALDWPISGEIIYNFGRVTGTNNTQTKQNGIGISAPAGASVRAVAAGRVEYASDLTGYGRTVVIVHPAGDYSVYGSLDRISVAAGGAIARGQILGTVGTSDASLGAHLHFEVRLNSSTAPLRAVDPLPVRRPRGG
jgi:septal ring factor EnvC (AmiA/AmiB activator)